MSRKYKYRETERLVVGYLGLGRKQKLTVKGHEWSDWGDTTVPN